MKKTLLLICTVLFTWSLTFAQVYVFEPFDYGNTGTSLLDGTRTNPSTSTTWNNYSAGSPLDMTVETDPGWALDQAFDLNPTGNAVYWQGGGEDGELDFPAVSGDGKSIYFSFLLDVVGWATTTSGHVPEQYRHVSLGINDSGNVGPGIHIGPTAAGGDMKFRIALGESDRSQAGEFAWYPTEYTYTDLGTDPSPTVNQFFIVIKFTINNDFLADGVTPTGTGYMWINPTIASGEPAPDVTHKSLTRNRTSFQSVLLQASSNNRNPASYVDEIRVTGSWEEALGLPALSVSKNEIEGLKVYPNPAKDYLTIESNATKISSIEMYNVLGAKVLSSKALVNNKLNVSTLSRGVYVLRINADASSSTRKIVIE
ncbi:T9SS type A sorting domain-containing protein [Mariniflexile soesokkakense]|uniref:T9SS type A sorting domain-containing protein n=1 Tax=Mariniflexile soesokkakense TaxID=1343160 RepID=A0ABV0ABI7_9FLAO